MLLLACSLSLFPFILYTHTHTLLRSVVVIVVVDVAIFGAKRRYCCFFIFIYICSAYIFFPCYHFGIGKMLHFFHIQKRIHVENCTYVIRWSSLIIWHIWIYINLCKVYAGTMYAGEWVGGWCIRQAVCVYMCVLRTLKDAFATLNAYTTHTQTRKYYESKYGRREKRKHINTTNNS